MPRISTDKNNINNMLDKLSSSKFRSRFILNKKEKEYVIAKGMPQIESHAREFIEKRISNAVIPNDGRQTPMHSHPVFIAQHATATCCRKCLYKWHNIKPGIELTKEEQDYITALIMEWIKMQMK